MNLKIILSICIPLHNRSEVVIQHIEELLKLQNDEFDIVVSDTSDEGKDLESVWGKKHKKVKIFRESATTPAMLNWKLALDHADGIFAFHLNDRDILLSEGLKNFIIFLKQHQNFNGGICKYVPTNREPLIYETRELSLMNVPYFAIHPTGCVFNTEAYRKLGDLSEVFQLEFGSHPHDVILGRLSESGKLFIFTEELWQMASHEFYKRNQSGLLPTMKDKLFFEQEERIHELKCFIEELDRLDFSLKIKNEKKDQMFRNYLRLATSGYFYVLESDYETAHYGIEKQKLNYREKRKIAFDVLDKFAEELDIDATKRKELKKWLAKDMLIPIVAKYTSKINNKTFRTALRKLRAKHAQKDNAILR